MLNEEINLILVGDTWHELPYYQREKADIWIVPDPEAGYRLQVVYSRLSGADQRFVQDVLEAMRCCGRFAPHPAEA